MSGRTGREGILAEGDEYVFVRADRRGTLAEGDECVFAGTGLLEVCAGEDACIFGTASRTISRLGGDDSASEPISCSWVLSLALLVDTGEADGSLSLLFSS